MSSVTTPFTMSAEELMTARFLETLKSHLLSSGKMGSDRRAGTLTYEYFSFQDTLYELCKGGRTSLLEWVRTNIGLRRINDVSDILSSNTSLMKLLCWKMLSCGERLFWDYGDDYAILSNISQFCTDPEAVQVLVSTINTIINEPGYIVLEPSLSTGKVNTILDLFSDLASEEAEEQGSENRFQGCREVYLALSNRGFLSGQQLSKEAVNRHCDGRLLTNELWNAVKTLS
ncbi:unnamed protein product [Phytophthora lilii]|uniref:Unnamed protein product n=1 Tax=Phytophthora lilii TaxID=2077276 RepID=A0A9W6X3C4_9STRA|nr:unnamed protein product [Phytophthora lilii]